MAGLGASLVLRADVAGIKCSRMIVAAPPRASALALVMLPLLYHYYEIYELYELYETY